MDFSGSNRFNIIEGYRKYLDIKSRNECESLRKDLKKLAEDVVCSGLTRNMIFGELSRLMKYLNLTMASQKFTCFYDFVFFICRENGQKSITVSMAIDAWRLVLNGRFRLLDQWCNFLERHNISEDTWQLLLAFSRSVPEDLTGYDPKGAWPVLIDEFVEYMQSRPQSGNSSSTHRFSSNSMDVETQVYTSGIIPGLIPHPGSKRKLVTAVDTHGIPTLSSVPHNLLSSDRTLNIKRTREVNAMNH